MDHIAPALKTKKHYNKILLYIIGLFILIPITIGFWNNALSPHSNPIFAEKANLRAAYSALSLICIVFMLCRQLVIDIIIATRKPTYAIVLKKTKTDMTSNEKPQYLMLLSIIDENNNVFQSETCFKLSWHQSCEQGDYVKIKYSKKGTCLLEVLNRDEVPLEIRNRLKRNK